MSRQRRQVLQLDEPSARACLSHSSVHDHNQDQDLDDDDGMDDMPTPERLVSQDPIPIPQMSGKEGGGEIDNKVANFLAEIDALDPGGPDSENSRSPVPMRAQDREEESPPRFHKSPPREKERSPHRPKRSAYSNMFVKGTPEFTKKTEEKISEKDNKVGFEPWPEEPKTDWQQLMDEKTKYPYYWNMVTNAVVWDMPPDFSSFLLLQKEYEEKVERGLHEGKLDPNNRNKKGEKKEDKKPGKLESNSDILKSNNKRPNNDIDKRLHHPSDSDDSSSDSNDSDDSSWAVKKPRTSKPEKMEKSHEMPSSSTSGGKDTERNLTQMKRSESPDLPDSTETSSDRKVCPPKSNSSNDEGMDFDIDDIDKELELALERKRQELLKLEEKKKDDNKVEAKEKERERDKHRDRDKKSSDHRHRDGVKRDDHHRRDDDRRKHSKHKDRDRDRERDRDRDKKHHKDSEKEEKKPKLTLKERLRVEMELKLEKERRKKRAIEEMMARELEKTVLSSKSQSHKRHRDDHDEPRKRYREDDIETRDGRDTRHHARDEFADYSRRGYDPWDRDRRGPPTMLFEDRADSPPAMKPPPPTAEMLAYEEERRSQVVDYGHGRSRHGDQNGGSDSEDPRSADLREIEIKKLEALQLAELALSKLEFLEVTKKGLSKLQILLIELETRHQDWQSGGLTTNHFLTKLREANWQLEQYEGSAAPTGWVCSWDRDYRRYFYTHKLTNKTQWDYPDADEIKTEDEKVKDKRGKRVGTELDAEISSTSDRGREYKSEKDITKEILASTASLPPPPPPPAEEHPSVKSLQLMYGSTSESDNEAEDTDKKSKKKIKKDREHTPPLPPLPKEDKHSEKDRKDKHKSKKKKKEKSKKKDKPEASAVGPMLPQAAPLPPAPTDAPMPYADQAQIVPPGTETDQQLMESWYQAQGTSEVPVYGPTSGPDIYGQNDQPLEFGTVEAGLPSQEGMEYAEGPQVSHPPETYMASTSVYPNPYGAGGDSAQAQKTEATEGAPGGEGAMGAVPNTEEKKKKKKEKMGSASISLKKKHVSSMVMKWQKVKKEVELEERDREIREAEIRKKLAELE